MPLDLTPEEAATVARKRSTDPPTYYAEGGGLTPVSEDFEAFLILAKTSVKAEAVNWLRGLALPLIDPLQQTLYNEAIEAEAAEALLIQQQTDLVLGTFNDFKAGFPGDSRFAAVPEVGLLLADTSLSIANVVDVQRSAKHREVAARMNQNKQAGLNPGLSEERKRQALSWVVPLSLPY